MTTSTAPVAEQTARFVVMYDTGSDVETFERHYNDVHAPLVKQYPGLRRYTRSREPAAVIDEVWSPTSPRELPASPSAW